jgi:hypothetical protein
MTLELSSTKPKMKPCLVHHHTPMTKDGDPFSVPSAKIMNHSLKEPIRELHLDEVTDGVSSLFTELCHTDEF